MTRRENVWANEGGTPGMPICKIEVGSEAWSVLEDALTSRDARTLRISASDGQLKIKVNDDIWTYQLDVEAELQGPDSASFQEYLAERKAAES